MNGPRPRGSVRLAALTYRTARSIAVAIVGATLLVVGVVLVFVPGPGIVAISLGLVVLAAEFQWARRWLRLIREKGLDAAGSAGHANGDEHESESGTRPNHDGSRTDLDNHRV